MRSIFKVVDTALALAALTIFTLATFLGWGGLAFSIFSL